MSPGPRRVESGAAGHVEAYQIPRAQTSGRGPRAILREPMAATGAPFQAKVAATRTRRRFAKRVNCFRAREMLGKNSPDCTGSTTTHGWGGNVEERPSESVHWYDITIAGKQFNIASRYGESHIRRLEQLLDRTLREMGSRVEGKNLATVALLAALNLADQLLEAEAARASEVKELHSRLELWLGRLDQVLGGQQAAR
jgi:cell division protein ZapA (FtsZ GTPase activity inhibitor)